MCAILYSRLSLETDSVMRRSLRKSKLRSLCLVMFLNPLGYSVLLFFITRWFSDGSRCL